MIHPESTEILKNLNETCERNLSGLLGIRFVKATQNFLSATMPVTPKIHQPYGMLHGGASVALAETLGSTLSALHIDIKKFYPVGININSNHLRSVKSGIITGTACFIRKGNNLHVSQIEILDNKGRIINYTTMTNAILPHKNEGENNVL
ncbi:MAG: hotdog fold thioesterase [Bergeyella sp.]|nr:hotdog fold thioesterase [Bergeyella sp.]